METSTREMIPWAAACLAACLALVGCEREPTPKMSTASSADSALSTSGPVAQADTGTAMGTGSAAGADAFDALTRAEPTAAGVPSSRQIEAADAASAAATLSGAERDFIARTNAKSLFEIRVSELAAEKATDPALKSYAALVAADHKGVTQEIQRLAAGQGVNLPQSLDAQDEKTLSALQNATGQAFDKQYLQTVGVTGHEKAIAAYEKAGTEARNPALKDYVQSTLPTLKSHLEAARKLQTGG